VQTQVVIVAAAPAELLQMQVAGLEYLRQSCAAQVTLAENYLGLPL
jgi:hypothetical protein